MVLKQNFPRGTPVRRDEAQAGQSFLLSPDLALLPFPAPIPILEEGVTASTQGPSWLTLLPRPSHACCVLSLRHSHPSNAACILLSSPRPSCPTSFLYSVEAY